MSTHERQKEHQTVLGPVQSCCRHASHGESSSCDDGTNEATVSECKRNTKQHLLDENCCSPSSWLAQISSTGRWRRHVLIVFSVCAFRLNYTCHLRSTDRWERRRHPDIFNAFQMDFWLFTDNISTRKKGKFILFDRNDVANALKAHIYIETIKSNEMK